MLDYILDEHIPIAYRNAILRIVDDFYLAIVEVSVNEQEGGKDQAAVMGVHYVSKPFQREPDFGVTSANYNLKELLGKAGKPA